MEKWEQIKDFPNYLISNTGKVKNIKKDKLMIIHTRKKYCFVKLSFKGKSVEKKVHRLVAEAFIPNDNANYTCINHKDENPANNNVDNLEWCDHKYNNTYGTRIERQKQKLKKPVLQYDMQDNFIQEFNSINDAAEYLNILPCNISNCLSGKQKSTPRNLYKWKYKV